MRHWNIISWHRINRDSKEKKGKARVSWFDKSRAHWTIRLLMLGYFLFFFCCCCCFKVNLRSVEMLWLCFFPIWWTCQTYFHRFGNHECSFLGLSDLCQVWAGAPSIKCERGKKKIKMKKKKERNRLREAVVCGLITLFQLPRKISQKYTQI